MKLYFLQNCTHNTNIYKITHRKFMTDERPLDGFLEYCNRFYIRGSSANRGQNFPILRMTIYFLTEVLIN